MNLTRLGVMLAALAQLVGAGMMDQMLVRDSLRQMPRWEQVRWLSKRGLADPYLRDCTPVQDSGLRCAGRWSYGPSTWVDVRATPSDTTVFLSRGSGVSIIRFRSQDSLRLDLLADINSHGLTGRCQVRDTLLYVNSGGVECYDIGNLSNPVLLNWLSQPLIYDFFVVDTLLYTSSRDSLRIFSVSNPASPRWLGACADSGYVMYVSGSQAYLGHQAGLFIVDVSNPSAPHRVATLGFDVLSIWVQDTLLYFGTYDSTFQVYNVKSPVAPAPVGSLGGIAPACLYLPPTCDTVIYSSSFDVISVANPATPHRVGSVSPPGWEYGVAAVPALNYALVADYFDGLAVIDIAAPQSPQIDSLVFNTGLAEDVAVDGTRLYVAGLWSGLHVLDVSNPAVPRQLGNVDVPGVRPSSYAVVARDSFAYIGWTPVPQFRSVSVSDPTRPTLVGGYDVTNYPEDMVLRDTLVFIAEDAWFQVVNVARPRQPVLVGSCVLPGDSRGVCLQDTLAFVTSTPTQVVNVADPAHLVVVGEFDRGEYGIQIRDTFAYMTGYYAAYIYSVADPTAPRFLDSVSIGQPVNDIALADSLAYFGCQDGVRSMSLADPVHPTVVGFWATPYLVWRLTYAPPYVYAACSEAGVCVLETTQTGIVETGVSLPRRLAFRARPNPTSGRLRLNVEGLTDAPAVVRLRDVTGRQVLFEGTRTCRGPLMLDLTPLPPGVYFVEMRTDALEATTKVCKR